ncbi:2-dehydro-3-deoxygalactonokinase [Cytobacillus massiliigabonensis]|uniref:2-dehydro-3-deoxygalactonokinase n=1 Tax=Cytobacillus massiliigabonensis TaxID=1871011 RepID=UPI000C851ACB|nr:2-dehydro-3-deoxygalactonokinase [Cytobacillus massiliigabonensis]
MKVILIDSGTTNSRLRLMDRESYTIIDSEKVRVGVRDTAIKGNNKNLIEQIRAGIGKLLTNNKLVPDDIEYIAASGMITSNLGVYEIPHITSPASLSDFAVHSKVIKLEAFYEIPCIFIPGMKNKVHVDGDDLLANINDFDVMRGEEVESFGLIRQFDVKGKGIMVLPGSHTKFVAVDEHQSLTHCLSTLGGETLMALQKETILSSSLDQTLVESIDEEMLKAGFNAAKQYGLTRSFYHVRLLHLFAHLNENQRANYFVGSIIYNDVQALFQSIEDKGEIKWFIVGGSNPLRKAFAYLLKYTNCKWEIIEANEQQVENSLIFGASDIISNKKGMRSIRL